MIAQLLEAVFAVFFGVGACFLYFIGIHFVLERIFADSKGANGAVISRESLRNLLRPWIFLLPAVSMLFIYLVYPVFETLRLSFHDFTGERFVGFRNYLWAVQDPELLQAIGNNAMWLVVVPTLSVFFGLLVAVLADRVWWGGFAKSMIFMPMAISFVGASVIWKFVYDFRGADSEQIGSLNALVMFFGGEPEAWITIPYWNNFFLMIILIWIQTGFAMVILSAALRSVPEETLEAARIDGANEIQVFL